MKVPISDITIDPGVQIREGLHEPAVEHYMEAWDALPPIQIIDTGEDWLLADGFHRVEAGKRRGESEISGEVEKGTRQDAIALSIVANAANAVPLTSDERRTAIRRLHDLGWSRRRITKTLGLSEFTVTYILGGITVEGAVTTGGNPTTSLKPSTYSEIARAPKEVWEPLVEAATEHQWEAMDTRQAVRDVKAGTPLEVVAATPKFDRDQPNSSTWGQILKDASKAAREDPLANVYALLKAAALIKAHLDPEMFADADAAERLRIYNGIEEATATLRRVQQYAQTVERVSA